MSGQTRGACAYCGRQTTRAHMARHLDSCERRLRAAATADAGPGPARTLLQVQARDAATGNYWINLELDGSTPLKKVDAYLRAIWLECCGHPSSFLLGGWGGREMAMARTAGAVLLPGVELTHIYDFGDETVTLLRSLGSRFGKPLGKHPITLMARNAPPAWECQACGEPATRVCAECAYEDEMPGTLCDRHARRHPHRGYGPPRPLLNSPRAGRCGYEGPAEAPY